MGWAVVVCWSHRQKNQPPLGSSFLSSFVTPDSLKYPLAALAAASHTCPNGVGPAGVQQSAGSDFTQSLRKTLRVPGLCLETSLVFLCVIFLQSSSDDKRRLQELQRKTLHLRLWGETLVFFFFFLLESLPPWRAGFLGRRLCTPFKIFIQPFPMPGPRGDWVQAQIFTEKLDGFPGVRVGI